MTTLLRVTPMGPILRAAPTADRHTLVYFVQEGDDGPIKIGHTNGDMRHRLRVMQNGNPRRLRVIATFRLNPFAERDIHNMLAEHRIHGEWFNPSPDIFRLVDLYRAAGFSA